MTTMLGDSLASDLPGKFGRVWWPLRICVWCLSSGFQGKHINCVLLYGFTCLPRLLQTVVN